MDFKDLFDLSNTFYLTTLVNGRQLVLVLSAPEHNKQIYLAIGEEEYVCTAIRTATAVGAQDLAIVVLS